MKKLIILLSIVLFSVAAKSQVIDTSFTYMTAVKIIPLKAKFSDTVNVDHLGIKIISDNLKSSCLLSWVLYDKNGFPRIDGTANIQGADYDAWNGNNLYPFIFVGKLYNLVFDNQ